MLGQVSVQNVKGDQSHLEHQIQKIVGEEGALSSLICDSGLYRVFLSSPLQIKPQFLLLYKT